MGGGGWQGVIWWGDFAGCDLGGVQVDCMLIKLSWRAVNSYQFPRDQELVLSEANYLIKENSRCT